jgi:hypothetical protein
MAITAINAQAADMVGMAELDRLVNSQILPGYVAGAHQHGGGRSQASQQQHGSHNAELGEDVETAVKDLNHPLPQDSRAFAEGNFLSV